MPRLRDALKRKFKSPQAALRALGLDETLIEQEQTNMQKSLLSRRAAVAKGALMAVLRPVLAHDAQLNLNGALKHLTTRNFSEEKDAIAKAIFNVASRKLARDQTLALDEVEKAMDVAEKDDEPEARDEEENMPKEGKNALDSIHLKKGMDAEGFKKMLKEKMSEDDYKAACDAMEPEEAEEEAEDEEAEFPKPRTESEKESAEMRKSRDGRTEAEKAQDKRLSKDKKRAKDAEPEERVEEELGKEKITKGAMDAALAAHGRKIRDTERAIRIALDQVRPLIGDLRADLAFDSATDVFRHAASVLEIKGAKTMHADALWPVIEATAQSKERPLRRQYIEPLGFDEESISEAVKIAPGLVRIRSV